MMMVCVSFFFRSCPEKKRRPLLSITYPIREAFMPVNKRRKNAKVKKKEQCMMCHERMMRGKLKQHSYIHV